MSDRKPVWMDEEAHGIVKTYSKLVKRSMADVTTELVMKHLDSLPAGAGLVDEAPEASAPAEEPAKAAKAEPAAPKAAPKRAPVETSRDESSRATRKPTEENGVRYLGGVWLV